MKTLFYILATTVLLSILILEIYFRVADQRFFSLHELTSIGFSSPIDDGSRFDWYNTASNRDSSFHFDNNEFSYRHYFNNELRNGVVDSVADSGVLRIICLGDSFTEGVGAPQDSTWPACLESILEDHPTSQKIEVINAGIMSSDPFFNYMLLKDKLLWMKPDVVIQAWNNTDVNDLILRGGFDRFKEDGSVEFRVTKPAWEKLYIKSMTVRIIVHGIFKYDGYFRRPSEFKNDLTYFTEQYKILDEHYRLLGKESGFLVLPIKIPLTGDVYNLSPQTNVLYNLIVDATPAFNKLIGIDGGDIFDYFYQIDSHCTPRGYYFVAKAVIEVMKADSTICPALMICEK